LGVVVAALLLCVVGWEGVMKGMERNNNKVATGEQFLEIAQVFGIWGLSPSMPLLSRPLSVTGALTFDRNTLDTILDQSFIDQPSSPICWAVHY
jgi:hypothetical protein